MVGAPNTEQLLIQVLLRSAQSFLRALANDKDTGPQRSQAARELELAFAPLWSRIPYLVLTCLDDRLEWDGRVVLSPEEDVHGLTRTLVTSGIHAVTFVPGCEQREVARFLELVDLKRRLDEDGDQDLVLMLFRSDLHYIRYTVGAPPSPPRTVAPPSIAMADSDEREESDPEALRAAVRADAETPDSGRAVVQLEKFDSTLYFLEKNEIEYLRDAITKAYSEDHSRNVIALLLDVLQLRSEPKVRDEVIEVLRNLFPYLLATGRFRSVAYLTGELRKVTRETTFDVRHKEALDGMRLSLSDTRALAQLFYVLDSGDVTPTAQGLGPLLREMPHDAIQTVLVWIGQLTRPEAKSAMLGAIEQFLTEWPAGLSRLTTSSNRTVVHRALGLATRLELADFAEPVSQVLKSDDATARRLAVGALSAIGTAQSLRFASGAASDDDAEVRVAVFRALAARPFRGAHDALRAALGSDDLESREISERRSLFLAFGAVAGPDGVATLEPILQGKSSLAKRPSPQTRACAAVALGVISTPAARLALQSAAKDRDPIVRSAVSTALRSEGFIS